MSDLSTAKLLFTKALSVFQITERPVIGILDNEIKRMWNGAVVAGMPACTDENHEKSVRSDGPNGAAPEFKPEASRLMMRNSYNISV